MKRFILSITSPGVGIGVLAGVLMGGLGGCSTDRVSQVGQEPRAAISDAALASYPQAPAASSDRVQAAAVDHPDLKEVEIFNLADQSIPAARVWVNGNFLAQINSIPPRGSVIVKYSNLLEAGRAVNDLKQLQQPVRKVELQTREGLFKVQGPAMK